MTALENEDIEISSPLTGIIVDAILPGGLEQIQLEVRWAAARANRIAAQRLLRDNPTPRRRKAYERRLKREVRLQDRLRLLRITQPSTLDRLCARYDLSEVERQALLLALAPCLSRRFDDLFRLLDGDNDAQSLTIEAIFSFAELSFIERIEQRDRFSPQGTLMREGLISLDMGRYSSPRDILTAEIELTGRAFRYLLEREGVSDEFMEFSSICEPAARFNEIVLPEQQKEQLLSVVTHHDRYLEYREKWGFNETIRYGRGMIMLFWGPPGTGKTMTAHAVADAMGKRVLNVDLATLKCHQEADRLLTGLFREARLQNAIIFFDECENLFTDREQGNDLMARLLPELERLDGVLIMATNLPHTLDPALERRVMVRMAFDPPVAADRERLWARHLPPAARLADDIDLSRLARRHPISGGYIKNAVLMALAEAVYEAPDAPILRMVHLDRAAHRQSTLLTEPRSVRPQRPIGFLRDRD